MFLVYSAPLLLFEDIFCCVETQRCAIHFPNGGSNESFIHVECVWNSSQGQYPVCYTAELFQATKCTNTCMKLLCTSSTFCMNKAWAAKFFARFVLEKNLLGNFPISFEPPKLDNKQVILRRELLYYTCVPRGFVFHFLLLSALFLDHL